MTMTMFSRGAMERVLEQRRADPEHHVLRLTKELKEARQSAEVAKEDVRTARRSIEQFKNAADEWRHRATVRTAQVLRSERAELAELRDTLDAERAAGGKLADQVAEARAQRDRAQKELKKAQAGAASALVTIHNQCKTARLWRDRAAQHRKEREGLKSQLEAAEKHGRFWARSYHDLAARVNKAIAEIRGGG